MMKMVMVDSFQIGYAIDSDVIEMAPAGDYFELEDGLFMINC